MPLDNFKPRRDLVLIDPVEQESIIIIPDEAKHGSRFGKVVYAGKDCDASVGDTVAFSEHTGEKTKLDGKMLLAIRVEDLLAVV